MVFDRDLKSFPSIRKQVETTKDKTLRSSKSPTPLSPQFSLLMLLYFSALYTIPKVHILSNKTENAFQTAIEIIHPKRTNLKIQSFQK